MGELRFDGQTAIVTGAGGNPSLGRAYAMILGARGANVVVNDLAPLAGAANLPGSVSAEAVAAEIRAAGGKAIADTHSVADPEGAEALVRTAIETFGGLDILVNNAGIGCQISIDDVTVAQFRKTIEVNLLGQAWMVKAALSHMRAKNYGRIVNVGSSALQGYSENAAYGASKGGVFTLTRAIAADVAGTGIKANILCPGGFSRMVAETVPVDSPLYDDCKTNLPAEIVAPVVAFLAHETCPVTGECIEAVGGQVRRFYLAQTDGFFDAKLTPETVAARWDEVMAGAVGSVLMPGVMANAERDG